MPQTAASIIRDPVWNERVSGFGSRVSGLEWDLDNSNPTDEVTGWLQKWLNPNEDSEERARRRGLPV